jgi:hypothetical protein
MESEEQQDLELFTFAENNDFLHSVDKQTELKQFLVILNYRHNVPIPVLLNSRGESGV